MWIFSVCYTFCYFHSRNQRLCWWICVYIQTTLRWLWHKTLQNQPRHHVRMFLQIFESFNISPYGYLRNRSIHILFHSDYNSQLRIEHYDALSRPVWCTYLRLLGKYKFIKGNVELPYDVMDGIHRLQFHFIPYYSSHNDFTSMTVSETPSCIHVSM